MKDLELDLDALGAIARNPKSLETLARVLENPRVAIQSLDLLIHDPKTEPGPRERYIAVRRALEELCRPGPELEALDRIARDCGPKD